MTYKDLIIISNEKVFQDSNSFYCNNLDLKVLPEGLNKYHKVQYIVRGSKKRSDQIINLKNIKVGKNIFKFIAFVINTLKISDATYLIVCITPYTFLSSLVLFLFRKRVFIYLFSSGHEEYKHILGKWFVWIYHIMFVIVTSYAKVIVCHKRLFDKKNSHIVYISRLDDDWFKDHKNPKLDKPKFLYVGRMSPEKGIFNFLEMFNKLKFDSQLSIVGNTEKNKDSNQKIDYLGYIANPKSLINIYDDHNILILPSFTEATPYVVDESLARKRPVIIFEDTNYIVRDKNGIFVSKRDEISFSSTTKYIMDNYIEIQKRMEKNNLPTKNSMIKQISDIIKSEN